MKSQSVLSAIVLGAASVSFAGIIEVPDTVQTQADLAPYIEEAQDGDVVRLPAGPIQFGRANASEDNAIVLSKSITLEGPQGGCDFVGNTASHGACFLKTASGTTVTLRNITFRDTYIPSNTLAPAPVRAEGDLEIEDCKFKNMHKQNGAGGAAALRTFADVLMTNCEFSALTITMGNTDYGGAWEVKGGQVDVYGCVFTNCFCSSGGGAVALLSGVTGARFENTRFLDCYTNNGGAKGGAILDLMGSSSTGLDVISCVFRHCRGKASVVYCDQGAGSHRLLFERCEFTDCFSQSWGTLVKSNQGNPTIFLFSTFANFVGSQWGAGMDIRQPTYMVNCTMVGGINLSNTDKAGGGLNMFANATVLNSVLAYNYHDLGNQNVDLAVYSGTTKLVNSIANSPQKPQYLSGSTTYALAESLQDVPDATELFGAYEEISSFDGSHSPYKGSFTDDQIVIGLAKTVVVPSLDKPRGPMKMLSVAPLKGGALYKKGFPVKANPSRTYLAYSEDKGETWTTLYGTDPNDGSVELITTDQLGQEFTKPPIGAVTLKRPGTAIIVR